MGHRCHHNGRIKTAWFTLVYWFSPQDSCGGNSLRVPGGWRQWWTATSQGDPESLASAAAGLGAAAATAGLRLPLETQGTRSPGWSRHNYWVLVTRYWNTQMVRGSCSPKVAEENCWTFLPVQHKAKYKMIIKSERISSPSLPLSAFLLCSGSVLLQHWYYDANFHIQSYQSCSKLSRKYSQ